MANTRIKDALDTVSIRHLYTLDHDGPTSYPTGGESIPATAFGFKTLANVVASGADDGSAFCAVRFSGKGAQTTFKLLWFVNTTGAEVANATNLSARFVRLTGYGR